MVRAFTDERVPHPLKAVDPVRDLRAVETEFILSDLVLIESRMERLAKQAKSQKNERDLRELRLLERCKAFLEEEKPLREFAFERDDELLVRGFRFLTQKPLIVVVNIDEGAISGEAEVRSLFGDRGAGAGTEILCLSARIEREIQQLSVEEASQFLKDFGLSHSARARLIATSFQLLGLISFFTVGEDEVKAWTVPAATRAVQAAGAIHSDIERGLHPGRGRQLRRFHRPRVPRQVPDGGGGPARRQGLPRFGRGHRQLPLRRLKRHSPGPAKRK